MEQYQEFVVNHPFLIAAFLVTLGMLVFVEFRRHAGGGKEVTPSLAVRLQNDDGLFLDVREIAEYKRGHVLNARHIPLKELADRVHELEKFKEKPVVVYCANGMRSAKATALLAKNGFSQVHSLAGGLAAWEKASLPLESS